MKLIFKLLRYCVNYWQLKILIIKHKLIFNRYLIKIVFNALYIEMYIIRNEHCWLLLMLIS